MSAIAARTAPEGALEGPFVGSFICAFLFLLHRVCVGAARGQADSAVVGRGLISIPPQRPASTPALKFLWVQKAVHERGPGRLLGVPNCPRPQHGQP